MSCVKKSETEVIINMQKCPSMLIGRERVNYSQTVQKVDIKLIGKIADRSGESLDVFRNSAFEGEC